MDMAEKKEHLRPNNHHYLPSKNFRFNLAKKEASTSSNNERCLVIIFGWLLAKQRHLDKYCQFYLAKGFDVLAVTLKLGQFLNPIFGSHKVASKVLYFLENHQTDYESYVFHGFSVGVYMMGEVFVMLYDSKYDRLEEETQKRLKGIIYDSPVDVGQAPNAISLVSTSNVLLRHLLRGLIRTYLTISYPLTTLHYSNASKMMKGFAFSRPNLVLSSETDLLIDLNELRSTIDKWRSKGIEVTFKCWENSQHVTHFVKHREEYTMLIENFLEQIL